MSTSSTPEPEPNAKDDGNEETEYSQNFDEGFDNSQLNLNADPNASTSSTPFTISEDHTLDELTVSKELGQVDSDEAVLLSIINEEQERTSSSKDRESRLSREDGQVDSEAVLLSIINDANEEQEHTLLSEERGAAADPDLSRIPLELQGLTHTFQNYGQSDEDISERSQMSQNPSHSLSLSKISDEQGIDEILKKLERLTNAQTFLDKIGQAFGDDIGGGGDLGSGSVESPISTQMKVNLDLKIELEQRNKQIFKLESEVSRQESLITAYHQDNQKLYNQLKGKEKEASSKDSEWESLVSSLKTEIASLKISRLTSLGTSPSRPGSASSLPSHQSKEIDRLTSESQFKSQQITELRREIILLRNQVTEVTQVKTSNQKKQPPSKWVEKEKELQQKIRLLTKQVRTLQKILYSKDPSNPMVKLSKSELYSSQEIFGGAGDTPATSANTPATPGNKDHVTVLENRVVDLERELQSADSDARERLKDFHSKLNGLKSKYEDQLKEYELQLEESSSKLFQLSSSSSQHQISELNTKLERSSSEISFLKSEISRLKRELEIVQKSSLSLNSQTLHSAKQDAGTLSLAIKSFKSELGEKEKEILRMKKEISELNRTNNNLKRERERYLSFSSFNNNPNFGGIGALPGSSAATRVVARVQTTTGSGAMNRLKGQKDSLNTNSKMRSPVRKREGSSVGVEILQAALESERDEFDQIIESKRKEIEQRDKVIKQLKKQIDELMRTGGGSNAADEGDESKDRILSELRSRVEAQNELILKLREHIGHYRRVEEDYSALKTEAHEATLQIKELRQKLDFAQTMAKPENEILELLGRKFDELNCRYLHREQQMETLLNRLAVRSSQHPSPRLALNCLNLNPGISSSLQQTNSDSSTSSTSPELDLCQLSPSLSIHLFANTPSEQRH